MDKLDRFFAFLERNRIIRKVSVIWAATIITVVVLRTTHPEVIAQVNAPVSTIVMGVIGLLSVVMNSLIKNDREGE